MTRRCDRIQVWMSVIIGPLRLGMRAQDSEGAPVNLSKRLR